MHTITWFIMADRKFGGWAGGCLGARDGWRAGGGAESGGTSGRRAEGSREWGFADSAGGIRREIEDLAVGRWD